MKFSISGRVDEKAALVQTARDWGYPNGAIRSRTDLWKGRRVLDVGMGAGPHSIGFIEGGAKSYTGVDPLLGSDHVRDFRNPGDPSIPAYHAFPYSMADIMRIYPTIKLYQGLLEDVAAEVRATKSDIALMSAVTEHLERPLDVFRAIWELLEPGGTIWMSHCNYYSWTGHHRAPRGVATWDRSDPEQAKHVDWQHLEPSHPDYANPNFNRVRMADFRDAVEKYFDIVEWQVSVEGLSRLTPELRAKWSKYSLEELLGQNIYITGRRRPVPRGSDLARRVFHHPPQTYLADRTYTDEPMEPYALAHSFYFSSIGKAFSHSDNDSAADQVFLRLKPGDKVTAVKFVEALKLTVKAVERPDGGAPRVTFVEAIPSAVLADSRDQWSFKEFGPQAAARVDRRGPPEVLDATIAAAAAKYPIIPKAVAAAVWAKAAGAQGDASAPLARASVVRPMPKAHEAVAALNALLLPILRTRVDTYGEAEAGAYNFYLHRLTHQDMIGGYEVAIANRLIESGVGAAGVHEIGCGYGQLLFLLALRGIDAVGIEIDPRRYATGAIMLEAFKVAYPEAGRRCRLFQGAFPLADTVLAPGKDVVLTTNLVATADRKTQLKILAAMRRYPCAVVDVDRFMDRRTDEEGRQLTLALMREAGFKQIEPFLDLGEDGRYYRLSAAG